LCPLTPDPELLLMNADYLQHRHPFETCKLLSEELRYMRLLSSPKINMSRNIDIKFAEYLRLLLNKYGVIGEDGRVSLPFDLIHSDLAELLSTTRVTITRAISNLKIELGLENFDSINKRYFMSKSLLNNYTLAINSNLD
jgi:biotin operon repressor